jgi:transposase
VAKGFKAVDRDQGFLLPVDMRDWLPADHLVWFVIEVIESLDLSAFRGRYRLGRAGREAFDPVMMVTLLAYAYCRGLRSSRGIERACLTDVAFRIVCGQRRPDHTVIARFRAGHEGALSDLFAQVLVVCGRAGMGQVDLVAIDGTKIAANAALDRSRDLAWYRKHAAAFLKEASQVDEAEDAAEAAAGEPADPLLRDPSGRRERIRQVLEEFNNRQANQTQPVVEAEARARQARADYEALVAARQAGIQAQRQGNHIGRSFDPDLVPKRHQAALRRAERAEKFVTTLRERLTRQSPVRVNQTDPQSKIMKTRQGWVQGYNCQIAVSADGLILVAQATTQATDNAQFIPIMTKAVEAVDLINTTTGQSRQIRTVLADAGYYSEANLAAPGPDRIIAAGKAHNITANNPGTGKPRPINERNTASTAMINRLSDPDTATLYKRRSALIEPINAHLKDRRGLRVFARRGQPAAHSELRFAAAITNLMRLRNTGYQPQPA